MDELEKHLREIVELKYNNEKFDSVRDLITDNYDLMPVPFVGHIEKSIIATATINSHSKEYKNLYPLVFRKYSDDYINLQDYFDEKMYCEFFAYLESILNNIKGSYYSDTVIEKELFFSCHLNLVPFSIKGEWNDLLYNDRERMKDISKGYLKNVLNNSQIRYLLIIGLDALDFVQSELECEIHPLDVDKKYALERYYYSYQVTKNINGEPIRLLGTTKMELKNLNTLIDLCKVGI